MLKMNNLAHSSRRNILTKKRENSQTATRPKLDAATTKLPSGEKLVEKIKDSVARTYSKLEEKAIGTIAPKNGASAGSSGLLSYGIFL